MMGASLLLLDDEFISTDLLFPIARRRKGGGRNQSTPTELQHKIGSKTCLFCRWPPKEVPKTVCKDLIHRHMKSKVKLLSTFS